MKITPREKRRHFLLSTRRVSPYLAWVDFHARSRFVRSTIPEEKWGTTRSLIQSRIDKWAKMVSSGIILLLFFLAFLWTLANIEISWPHSWLIRQIYYMTESANPPFWLATRAGKMGLSCPLGISRLGPTRKKLSFSPYNKFFIDQVCSVKMAWYWPRSVLRF